MSVVRTSFNWGGDSKTPVIFEDYAKAKSCGSKVIKPALEKDPDELIKDMVSKKRKRASELEPKKRAKQSSISDTPPEVSSTVADSDDEDLEWSGDELELSRNISILEQSMNQKSDPQVDTSKLVEDDLDWSDDE